MSFKAVTVYDGLSLTYNIGERSLLIFLQCFPAEVVSIAAQLVLDLHETVVLGDTLSSGHGAGLDHGRAQSYRQICDGCILGLARTMGYHVHPAISVSQVHGLYGLGE